MRPQPFACAPSPCRQRRSSAGSKTGRPP
jgi:hypothetical protein